jgi:hypothetical protein
MELEVMGCEEYRRTGELSKKLLALAWRRWPAGRKVEVRGLEDCAKALQHARHNGAAFTGRHRADAFSLPKTVPLEHRS